MNDLKGGPLSDIKGAAKLRLVNLDWRMRSPGKNARLGTRAVCFDDMGAVDFCNGALGTVGVMAL